jgi:Zn-finger nucleic acid-binding protein
MRRCPIHNIRMETLEEELITGKVAKVDYCERCNDVYIPERELSKYEDAKKLKRRLAKALSTEASRIDILRADNKLIIYQTS